MNYTLFDGDFVIVENITAGMHVPSFYFYKKGHIFSHEAGIHRGDLMVFKHPLDNRLYIKRCVALPGDSIFEKNKNFYLQIDSNSTKTADLAKKDDLDITIINSKIWLKNPYSHFYAISHDKRVIGPKELIDYPEIRILPHHYFFMGDFRDNSTDSRFFGPVNYDQIYYKVWITIKKAKSLKDMISKKY